MTKINFSRVTENSLLILFGLSCICLVFWLLFGIFFSASLFSIDSDTGSIVKFGRFLFKELPILVVISIIASGVCVLFLKNTINKDYK